jgi:hypothetical protein
VYPARCEADIDGKAESQQLQPMLPTDTIEYSPACSMALDKPDHNTLRSLGQRRKTVHQSADLDCGEPASISSDQVRLSGDFVSNV